jgi:cell division protein FtsZ
VVDQEMEDEIRITVIATGFDQAGSRPRSARTATRREEPESVDFAVSSFDEDDIEIPAFLRRRS